MEDKIKLPAPVPTSTSIEGMSRDVAYLRRDVDEMKINHEKYHKEVMEEIRKQSDSFITKAEFVDHKKISDDHETRIRTLESGMEDAKTVKRIVYGLVALMLTAVIVELLSLAFK